ncbi:MAG: M23 family metallopeptidase [Cytophagaceae bacterium]
MRKIFSLSIVLFFAQLTFAQQPGNPKNNTKEFNNSKSPAIQYQVPDANSSLFEEEIIDTIAGGQDGFGFDPSKHDYSIIEEDTLWQEGEEVGEDEFAIVEVQEQIIYDTTWVTIATYYSIWDTRNIDPYKLDPADFKDSIAMLLYDTINGRGWSMPLATSVVNSRFGMRGYRWHYGTDLDITVGDPILACFDGVVRISQYNAGGYGYYVVIRHYNGLETLYGHMSRIDVKVNQVVKAGEVIGLGGNTGRSTGPHLHFEVRYVGNAFNPEYIYDFRSHTIKSNHFLLTPEHYGYAKEARKIYYHTVRSGESLGSISRKYGVSISQLCKLNRMTTKSVLRVGQKIRIR